MRSASRCRAACSSERRRAHRRWTFIGDALGLRAVDGHVVPLRMADARTHRTIVVHAQLTADVARLWVGLSQVIKPPDRPSFCSSVLVKSSALLGPSSWASRLVHRMSSMTTARVAIEKMENRHQVPNVYQSAA
jgi:hypothetical protein